MVTREDPCLIELATNSGYWPAPSPTRISILVTHVTDIWIIILWYILIGSVQTNKTKIYWWVPHYPFVFRYLFLLMHYHKLRVYKWNELVSSIFRYIVLSGFPPEALFEFFHVSLIYSTNTGILYNFGNSKPEILFSDWRCVCVCVHARSLLWFYGVQIVVDVYKLVGSLSLTNINWLRHADVCAAWLLMRCNYHQPPNRHHVIGQSNLNMCFFINISTWINFLLLRFELIKWHMFTLSVFSMRVCFLFTPFVKRV